MITDEDIPHIQAAVECARLSISEDDAPRPKVGAVLVKKGVLLAMAHRGESGPGEHAEYCLLERKLVHDDVSGATLYCTLEPCTGRNSCVQRLIDRKIRRVVIGMFDPHPFHSFKSSRQLSAAGIEVDLFPKEFMAAVEELNRAFIAERGKDPFDGRMSSG